METVQKSVDRLNYRQLSTSTHPGLLCLNLPPELAQKFVVYGLAVVVMVVVLGWFGYTQVSSSQAPPTIKIGLVAPFEGLYRASGYEVLFAVKLALQERNAGAGLHGYRVELVALNDFNNGPEAAKQARLLVADPDIMGVIGHLVPEATQAALPIYREANLAVVIPWSVEAATLAQNEGGVVSIAATIEETNERLEVVTQGMGIEPSIIDNATNLEAVLADTQAIQLATDAVTAGNILLSLPETPIATFGQVETGNIQLVQVAGPVVDGFTFVSPGPGAAEIAANSNFVEAYQAMTGLLPGPRAALAYDATNVLLDSIERVIIEDQGYWYSQQPSRLEVNTSISTIHRQGISGKIEFNPNGQRTEAPIWIYQITESTYPGIVLIP